MKCIIEWINNSKQSSFELKSIIQMNFVLEWISSFPPPCPSLTRSLPIRAQRPKDRPSARSRDHTGFESFYTEAPLTPIQCRPHLGKTIIPQNTQFALIAEFNYSKIPNN